MLTSKQKSYLRSRANTMESIIQVGKGGVTATVLTAIDQALTARELIKISVLPNCPLTPQQTAQELVAASNSQLIQQLGNKIVLFRENTKKPVINWPHQDL